MKPRLLRRLNTFDLALICIGTVIGSGIFRTPAAVAQRAHSPALVLTAWIVGGGIALIGAFIFAELAGRRPLDGGMYGYLTDAYHPIVGFLFGWTLLLISGTGANAAAAVLFAGYLQPLTGIPLDHRVVAASTLLFLAGINVLGVRQGGDWQNAIVLLKIVALSGLIAVCLASPSHAAPPAASYAFTGSAGLLGAFGVAMLPVLFSYNGFQGSTFVTAETVAPERTIPRGLVFGMTAVVVIYVLANVGYLDELGSSGLAASTAPAAAAVEAALGSVGGKLIAIAIALSTLGYLSTCMLIHPRVYYHMAADGLFFRQLAWISPKTHVPVVAILLQAVMASLIAISGSYEQIINWVVLPQWLFVWLCAIAVFIFRRRDAGKSAPFTRVPGHPYTTALFVLTLAGIFVSEVVIYPRDTTYGVAVVASGAVVFMVWQRWTALRRETAL